MIYYDGKLERKVEEEKPNTRRDLNPLPRKVKLPRRVLYRCATTMAHWSAAPPGGEKTHFLELILVLNLTHHLKA